MSARFDRPAQTGDAMRGAMPTFLTAQIGSLVPAAADPHTQAITVWNGASAAAEGRIEVDLLLEDDAEGYELIDAEGGPVPHLWLGDRGEPPTRLDLPRHEVPDFDGVMAYLDGDRVLGPGIRTVSMRVLRDTLHVEITMGDQAVLQRADLEEMVHDAFSLADDTDCRRVAVTLHRAAVRRLAAWVPSVPAYGYRTLLVRPRPRPKAGAHAPAGAMMPMELIPPIEHRIEAISAEDSGAGGDWRNLPTTARVDAVDLHAHVAPCVEGILPPSASLVTASPDTLVLGDLKEAENGDGILLRLNNEEGHVECAHLKLLLAARAAELIDLNGRPIEVLWESEQRTDFTVPIPPNGTVTVRLRWAFEESSAETR